VPSLQSQPPRIKTPTVRADVDTHAPTADLSPTRDYSPLMNVIGTVGLPGSGRGGGERGRRGGDPGRRHGRRDPRRVPPPPRARPGRTPRANGRHHPPEGGRRRDRHPDAPADPGGGGRRRRARHRARRRAPLDRRTGALPGGVRRRLHARGGPRAPFEIRAERSTTAAATSPTPIWRPSASATPADRTRPRRNARTGRCRIDNTGTLAAFRGGRVRRCSASRKAGNADEVADADPATPNAGGDGS